MSERPGRPGRPGLSGLSGRPLDRLLRGVVPGPIEVALDPVAAALIGSAEASARTIRARARSDADATVAGALADAERVLAAARAEGAEAAAREVARQLVEARRQTREAVLGARRHAYETLRESAVEALVRQASVPAGQWIGERLAQLVAGRAGGRASVSRAGPGGLEVVAESRDRRVAIGPLELVDQVLGVMPDEVEALWR